MMDVTPNPRARAPVSRETHRRHEMKKKLLAIVYVLSLGGALVLPPIGAAQPLYEAAKKEGKVVVYGWGDDVFQVVAKAFMRRYGDIKLEGLDMRGEEAREKIIAEHGARQIVADLISSGENSIAELRLMGLVAKYESSELK